MKRAKGVSFSSVYVLLFERRKRHSRQQTATVAFVGVEVWVERGDEFFYMVIMAY